MDSLIELQHVKSPELRRILRISRSTFYRLLVAGLPAKGEGRLRRHPVKAALAWYGEYGGRTKAE